MLSPRNLTWRILPLAALAALGSAAFAGTLTVTSPTAGSYLGLSNTLSFNIKGASVKVNVKATITGPNGSTTIQNDFTPDTDGNITNSLPLNFPQNAAQGQYTIQVTATEPGNTYAPVSITANVDTLVPKLLNFSPLRGSFVKGNVPIRFQIQEANVKQTRVTVNGNDVPNNTGTSNTVDFTYDTSGILQDGAQTIALNATDLANNTLNSSINVTLDRNAPVTTIQYPRSDTAVKPRTDLSLIIDITDQFADAVDLTGVDVVVQRLDGAFLTRGTRISFASVGGNVFRWTGRLRVKSSNLPPSYKLVVSAIDKAGNVAVRQEVTVHP